MHLPVETFSRIATRLYFSAQVHIHQCKNTSSRHSRTALNALSWPIRQKDIIKGRERIIRLCHILNSAVALDNAAALANMEKIQKLCLERIEDVLRISHNVEQQKWLTWLSALSPKIKHATTTSLLQPETSNGLD